MQTNTLTGKRILLTGATGSLGSETAVALARMGAELILPVRNVAKAESLKTKLLKAFPEAVFQFHMLDMADELSIEQYAQQLCKEQRPLDALIHNAGVFTKAGLVSPQGEEWHRQVNAHSPLLLTQRLLPLLQMAEEPTIVTVTSLSAFWLRNVPKSTQSPTKLYAASKRLLMDEMQQLSARYPTIRFVYAHPGVCATGLFTGSVHATAYNRTLLKLLYPLMKALFPSPEQACKTTLDALLHAESGQLAEPSGPMHIWGRPRLVALSKRL